MTADTTHTHIGQSAPTTHEGILAWVAEIAELTQPAKELRTLKAPCELPPSAINGRADSFLSRRKVSVPCRLTPWHIWQFCS